MSRSTERASKRPAAELPAPPPGSADSEVDVIITTRDDGPGLSDLVKRLPRREIHDLFIVDGGSTDVVTVGILDELETGGYHVIRQDHHGLSRARNAATRVSQAPFLLYLDVGTVPEGGFLSDASTRLNDDSSVAAVLADGQWEGGEPIAASELDPRSMVGALRFEPFAVLRQAAIEKVGGWDEQLETGQDRDLFLSLTESDWSFAKLPTIGFTRIADAEKPVPRSDPSSARADGIRIAEKHRELYGAHLTTIIGAYEAALAEAGREQSPGTGAAGGERTVHDLMDQLAAVRADLARSEADGVRARAMVADLEAARMEGRRRAEGSQAVLEERIATLDREIAAVHATKTLRLLRVPRRAYAMARTWLR
ncbi:MAG: glycosyltransferase family A protein [Acidimicrobiales bacterium]|jgi:hypothetical protein